MKLFLLILFLPLLQNTNGQECEFVSAQYQNATTKSLPESGCDNYIRYAPVISEHMPIKTIRIILHVIQKDDGSRNFQDTPEDIAKLNSIFTKMNELISDMPDPVPESSSVTIRDSRLRIHLDQILFHQSTYFWRNTGSNGPSTGHEMYDYYVNGNSNVTEDAIHIFLIGTHVKNGNDMFIWGAYTYAAPNWGEKWIVEKSLYHQAIEQENSEPWILNNGHESGHLMHEIGHCFGLGHPDWQWCTDIPPDNYSGNNFMAHVSNKKTFSECQLARMHYYLEGKCTTSGSCSTVHQTVTTDYATKDDSYDIIIPDGETVVWDVDRKLTTDVVIQGGGELIVQCKLGLPTDGGIYVRNGARLFVDGGTITHNHTMWDKADDGYWSSIFVEGSLTTPQSPDMRNENTALDYQKSGIVLIKNGTIEYAQLGVLNEIPPTWNEAPPVHTYDGFVYAENSTFSNNIMGSAWLFSNTDFTTFSGFENCDFINDSTDPETVAIISSLNDLEIDDCSFSGNTGTGIEIFNKGATITKCDFTDLQYGVIHYNTYPHSINLQIGSYTPQLGNTFTNNEVGIYSNATNQLMVQNNTFDNNTIGISVMGDSYYDIKNNNFNNSTAAIDLVQTGSQVSKTRCNYFVNDFIGYDITGNNWGLKFFQQDFITDYDMTLSDEGGDAGRLSNQGTSNNGVWNYFSSGWANNQHIFTSGTTVPFYYFHPSESIDSRLKPKCALNDDCTTPNNFYAHQASGEDVPPPACSNDPDPFIGDGPCKEISKTCLTNIRDEITVKEAISSPTDDDKIELEALKTAESYILWKLVNTSLDAKNYPEAEDLLTTDGKKIAKKYLVGTKVVQKQYDTAENTLSDYPEETTDDTYFKTVQNINIDMLRNGTLYATPYDNVNGGGLMEDRDASSEDRISILTEIAEGREPSSIYARGLLAAITGKIYMPELPEMAQKRRKIIAENENNLLVYPNPGKDKVNITIPLSMLNKENLMVIYNQLGQKVAEIKNPAEIVTVSKAEIGKGIFIVSIKTKDNKTLNQKFIIH